MKVFKLYTGRSLYINHIAEGLKAEKDKELIAYKWLFLGQRTSVNNLANSLK